jgi:putative membrane protein
VRFLPAERFQRWLFIIALALFGLTCIKPPYPVDFTLEHIPTVVAIVTLVYLEQSVGISRFSYGLIITFFLLHVLGARYLYSNVPYDDWSKTLFGVTITDTFGLRRNHYDRFVHFAFGVLISIPAYRFLMRWLRLPSLWAAAVSLMFIMAVGSLYEMAEWGVAMIFAPDTAERYNGQQGDIWDAHRDTLLAMVGAMLGLAGALLFPRRAPGPSPPQPGT